MSETCVPASETAPLFRYLMWRSRPEPGMSAEALRRRVRREEALIEKALAMPEAASVAADAQTVAETVDALLAGEAGEGTDPDTLTTWGLDRDALGEAVSAELRAGTLLERAAATAVVSEAEVCDWFERNRERMVRPEVRQARHLLITINDAFPENRRAAARTRLAALAGRLEREPFATLAACYSECPTALEGGRLGRIRRGQLYPELERALFALEEGGTSGIVESPLGFHLLHCEAIEPERPLSHAEAAPGIRRQLEARARKRAVADWLSGKRAGELDESESV